METKQILDNARDKFKKALEHFESEIGKLRTGRAHPSMLEGVMVEAYGAPMPLNQVATVSAPEATLIQISPFDPNNLEAINQAIKENQSLGLNPTDDGRIIRVPIPALTEERRKEIAKQLGVKAEDANIAMRQARHDALKEGEQLKKDKAISDDDYKHLQNQLDEMIQEFKQKIDASSKAKEQEILTI
jgi:ribosome recycling factor